MKVKLFDQQQDPLWLGNVSYKCFQDYGSISANEERVESDPNPSQNYPALGAQYTTEEVGEKGGSDGDVKARDIKANRMLSLN